MIILKLWGATLVLCGLFLSWVVLCTPMAELDGPLSTGNFRVLLLINAISWIIGGMIAIIAHKGNSK